MRLSITMYTRVILGAIAILIVLVLGVWLADTNQQGTYVPTKQAAQVLIKNTPQTKTTFSCSEYETLFTANYYQQLYISWATLSRLVSVAPNQSRAFLNYEYNIAAGRAYDLYTNSLDNKGCTPTVPAPTSLSPAAPAGTSFSPQSLNPNIPTSCNLPLALQYVDIYNQLYIQNMVNEQSDLESWLSNQPQSPGGGITLKTQQGAASVQRKLYINAQTLVQNFEADTSNIGC